MTKRKKQIKIIAHRGASMIAPENTIASFRKALQLGAKAIELDVHFSKDGHLVVHHDYLLGHPDNGKGLIYKKDWKQIKNVDAGTWFSSEFKGEKIPSLEDVFREFGGDFEYEIELKGTTLKFLNEVFDLVRQYGLSKNIEFTSPHLPILMQVKELSRNAKIGIFFSVFPKWMGQELGEKIIVDTMSLMKAEVAHLPREILKSALVNSLHKAGFLVHAADCNSQDEIKTAISLGCDQFSTNDLELAQKIISA